MLCKISDDVFQQSLSHRYPVFFMRNFLDEQLADDLFHKLNDRNKFRPYKITTWNEEQKKHLSSFSESKFYSFTQNVDVSAEACSSRGNGSGINRSRWIENFEIPEEIENLKKQIEENFGFESNKILVELIESGPYIHPNKYQKFEFVGMVFLGSPKKIKIKEVTSPRSRGDMFNFDIKHNTLLVVDQNFWGSSEKIEINKNNDLEKIIVISFISDVKHYYLSL